jgi:hypothetical protein
MNIGGVFAAEALSVLPGITGLNVVAEPGP